MNALHTILTIIQVILAVGLVVIVTIQSGKSAGLSGAIAGGSGDTYLGKNKNKGLDAKLALATKWVGGVFIVLTLVLNLYRLQYRITDRRSACAERRFFSWQRRCSAVGYVFCRWRRC